MNLIVGEIYVLDGWLFDDYVLESNGHLFEYTGSEYDDGWLVAKFVGVENQIEQWATHSTLEEDEDVTCMVYEAD